MSELKPGDRLYIVSGLYKKNRTGTYLRPYGTKMCAVKVDGDKVKERNLWLSSVHKVFVVATHSPERKRRNTVSIPKADYKKLLDDIDSLTMTMNELQVRVKSYENY